MTLADSIYAYLATRTTLTDIVGDGIFHSETERQNPARAVYFEEIGDHATRGFVQSPSLMTTRVSFECWASDQPGAAIVSGAVAADAMWQDLYAAFCDPAGDKSGNFAGEMGTGGVYVQDVRFESGPRPLYDEGAHKFGREIDFTFDYRL